MREDLSAFFGDFSTSVQANGCTFTGIIDAPYVGVGEVAAVESAASSRLAKSADVASLGQGDVLVIESVEYVVRGIEPDGLGITTLRLETV